MTTAIGDTGQFPADDRLAVSSTPLERADRLASELGLAPGGLWIKRDDLTPLGGGGNKARKLQRLGVDAAAQGADVLLTGGGQQSNHVRVTAAAAARLGLDCHVVLAGLPPKRPSGNLVVDVLLGAVLHWTGSELLESVEVALTTVAQQLTQNGRRVYQIPVGGSSPTGSWGYVQGAHELRAALPELELVVTADGSGGTHAGLSVGLGDHEKVLGVNVGAYRDVARRVDDLAGRTAELAGHPRPRGTPRVDERYAEAGYGSTSPEVLDALRLAARTEGLILDPVYTGKALAALAAGLRDGTILPDGPVVFLHTGGAYGLLSDRYATWASKAAPWL